VSGVRALRKLQTDDDSLNKVQDNLEYVLAPLLQSAILNGVQVNGAIIGTAPTNVDHGLGRTPLGYLIVSQNNGNVPYLVSKNSKVLVLQSAGSVTLNLWIY